jgi:hypothetical protein
MPEKKRVKFSMEPITIHPLITWNFAYRQSRDGSMWTRAAIDRCRFQYRIIKLEKLLVFPIPLPSTTTTTSRTTQQQQQHSNINTTPTTPTTLYEE